MTDISTETSLERLTWDQTWLAVADTIAQRSRCVRAQVGCVIVTRDKRVASSGFNGPAPTWPHSGPCINWCPRAQEGHVDRGYLSCPALHAEANAMLRADWEDLQEGIMYISGTICWTCAKLVAGSGISDIVMRIRTSESHRMPEEAVDLLTSCAVNVILVESD